MEEMQTRPAISVLVVEDSRTQAEFLRYMLEQEGYDIPWRADGEAAVRRIGADRPNIAR